MPTNATSYLLDAVRDHLFRTTTLSQPANVYVGLHIGDESEVSGGAYARVAVATTDAAWADDGTGTTSNVADVTFPAPVGANWGTVTYFSIWDASSGGNCWFGPKALTAAVAINDGDAPPSFAAGDLAVTIATT